MVSNTVEREMRGKLIINRTPDNHMPCLIYTSPTHTRISLEVLELGGGAGHVLLHALHLC